MKPIFETIYDSGTNWLRDAGYAVIVLLAAVTFPIWAVPYWIGTKKKVRDSKWNKPEIK